jgi:hypothetical protein
MTTLLNELADRRPLLKSNRSQPITRLFADLLLAMTTLNCQKCATP